MEIKFSFPAKSPFFFAYLVADKIACDTVFCRLGKEEILGLICWFQVNKKTMALHKIECTI